MSFMSMCYDIFRFCLNSAGVKLRQPSEGFEEVILDETIHC